MPSVDDIRVNSTDKDLYSKVTSSSPANVGPGSATLTGNDLHPVEYTARNIGTGVGILAGISGDTYKSLDFKSLTTGSGLHFDSLSQTLRLSMLPTGVTPGTFGGLTVDATGRVTSARSQILLHSDVVTVSNASQTSYTFTRGSTPLGVNQDHFMAFRNRLLLRENEYTISGNAVTYSTTLSVSDELEIVTMSGTSSLGSGGTVDPGTGGGTNPGSGGGTTPTPGDPDDQNSAATYLLLF